MVHAFTASEGFALLALLFVGGLCGLRMCRAMLRSPTAFDLRREAAIAMTKPASFSSLNSHQQAAVFRALSECGPRRVASIQPDLSRGFQNTRSQRTPVPLRTFIDDRHNLKDF
ncbi:hypothetical protein D3C71_1729300 [compost metagenome]